MSAPLFASKRIQIITAAAAFGLLLVTLTFIALNNLQPDLAKAGWDGSKYVDTVTNPQQIIEYSYRYNNVLESSATGNFSFTLQNDFESIFANEGTVQQLANTFDVVSVQDMYPINFSTGQPLDPNSVTTREYAGSAAVYTETNRLKIRFAPQNPCTPNSGNMGCQNGLIAGQTPGKITIKLALKSGASTSPGYFSGSGFVDLVNGQDGAPIQWLIYSQYNKSTLPTVLDPQVTALASIKGMDGVSVPTIGQSGYKVVVSNIKSLTGQDLNTGRCRLESTNQTTPISNGSCVFDVTQTVTSELPGGTVSISDQGQEQGSNFRSLQSQVNYAGVSLTNQEPPASSSSSSSESSSSSTQSFEPESSSSQSSEQSSLPAEQSSSSTLSSVASSASSQAIIPGTILIEEENIIFTPSKEFPPTFGESSLQLQVKDSRIQDGATCEIIAKVFGSNQAYSPTWLTNATSTYDQDQGCQATLPVDKQISPKWQFKIRVTNPPSGSNSGQVFGANESYFMNYGAVGVIEVGAEVCSSTGC